MGCLIIMMEAILAIIFIPIIIMLMFSFIFGGVLAIIIYVGLALFIAIFGNWF